MQSRFTTDQFTDAEVLRRALIGEFVGSIGRCGPVLVAEIKRLRAVLARERDLWSSAANDEGKCFHWGFCHDHAEELTAVLAGPDDDATST
jgi:hypothetical protein